MKKWLKYTALATCLVLGLGCGWLWTRSAVGGDVWFLRKIQNDSEGSQMSRLTIYTSDGGVQILFKRRRAPQAEADSLTLWHRPPHGIFQWLATLQGAWGQSLRFKFRTFDRVYDTLTSVPGRTVHVSFPIWCMLILFAAPLVIVDVRRRRRNQRKLGLSKLPTDVAPNSSTIQPAKMP